MLIDPLIVTAVFALIAALGGLFIYFLRSFSTGDLMSKNVVPRADYEVLRADGARDVAAIEALSGRVDKLADAVALLHNGTPKAGT